MEYAGMKKYRTEDWDGMNRTGRYFWVLIAIWLLLFLTGCATQQVPAPATRPTGSGEIQRIEETEPEPVTVTEQTAVAPEETQLVQLPEPEAAAIDGRYTVTLDGRDITALVSENTYYRMTTVLSHQKLRIESEMPFGSLYIKWYIHPGLFTLVWDGGSIDYGAEGFLHEYIRLPEEIRAVDFVFAGEVSVSEIGLYTQGTAPEGVQDWLAPCETADILVFPTHSDDDALFFGAVISHYAIEEELTVQTAFMTDHFYEPVRNHERLDGLWEMGVRHYPLVGPARDYYSKSMEETAYYHRNDGILEWQVQMIRRFKPLVILGHDPEGEYGHCQHILNTQYLLQAVELAGDPDQFPESARQYGIWDTPKLYLHLYEENRITFDVNTPLGKDPAGRTAMEIAAAGYKCHVSQHKYLFQVSDNPNSPMDCTRFGLCRTLVGYDTGADLMEHTARGA